MRSSENGAISARIVLDQRQAGFRRPDFGDRGGGRPRQLVRGARWRICIARHAGPDASTRSASTSSGECSSTSAAMSGWSAASAKITAGGASALGAERLGHGAAHQRRGIVEQHDERAFGGEAVVAVEIGDEVGPREGAGGIGALTGRSRAHPVQVLTCDHRDVVMITDGHVMPISSMFLIDDDHRS